jgi:hypothetical protein
VGTTGNIAAGIFFLFLKEKINRGKKNIAHGNKTYSA